MLKVYTKMIWIVSFIGLSVLTACSGKQSSSKQPQNNEMYNSKMIINSVTPVSGIAGTSVVISGSGFGSSHGTIKLGDTVAPISSWSDTSISFEVPDITAGSTKINVVSGTSITSTDFTILPFISGIDKTDVTLNDTLVITGTSFGNTQNGNTINYAGIILPVVSWSNNSITLTIGNITHVATGLLNMMVNNTVSNGITLTVHPSIFSVKPDTAERGDEISIYGNLFGSNQGTSIVTFSGIPAEVTSWSDNFIKARVPENAVKGEVTVKIDNIVSSAQGFTVTKTFYSINQPTGLAMDENGNMYVANYTDGTIIKVLPGGITQTTLYKGLSHPMGLYYHAPSTLFVACEGDGTIQRLTLGTPVTGYTFASGFSQPAGMVFDDAGNMYVTNYGNNTISKIDLGNVVSTFATGFNKPMGIVFTGPTGGKTFWVVNRGNGTISIVNLLGVVTTYITGLNAPGYMLSDSAYNLYITSNNNIIKVLSPSGFTITYATGLSNPHGLVMDPSGYIYASNFDANTISKIDNGYQVYAKGLYNPYGITFSPSGTMFVTNQGNKSSYTGGSISVVTLNGETKSFVKPFDYTICGNSNMMPMGITIGFHGDLFVTTVPNTGVSSISEVTYDGNASILGNCLVYLALSKPSGIAFSSVTQLLYIADVANGKVFTLAPSFSSLFSFVLNSFASGFSLPNGITIDQSGRVYVANTGNGTISQITPAGTSVITYASGFNQPYGIVFDSMGSLYVSNYSGNSISLVTSGKQVYTIADGIQHPTGIAIDNAGYVYVASESAGKVYRLIHPAIVYASGFNAPKGLTKGIDGLIYIADSINDSIFRLEASGSLTNFAVNITSPAWFSFDNANNVFLSSFSNSTILKLSNNNLSTFATGLNGPTGIAYDSFNGLLYVGNYLNGTLSIIDNLGNVSTFAIGLSGPMGVVLLSPGNLYVANSSNGTVAKVVQGSGVDIFASGFGLPIGLALDSQSNLYVADQNAGMIFTISPTGVVSPYVRVDSPYGIAFDSNGNLFVSDTKNKQIKEIILH
ncbi:MAG: SMP-30/gluconolactonase/LRE family protein [bacterium]